MNKKRLLKKPIVHVSIAGIVIAAGIAFLLVNRGAHTASDQSTSSASASEAHSTGDAASSLAPMRLKIPSINVDARVEQVGVTRGGNMEVPRGPDNVAWFKLGPRPGQIGSAVIAGHEGWKNGIPAVFDTLHTLKPGDTLSVEDETGATNIFVVRELKIYGEHDDASAVFGSSDGASHLNLVTCHGIWNKDNESYSKRLVVFTDKEIN